MHNNAETTVYESLPSLAIFFPAYNDSASIGRLVETALRVAPKITKDFEIIVINDGSKDNTGKVLDELAATYPQVRVVHHKHNMGYGAALISGFSTATKEWVFYTDGDGQYDISELQSLAEKVGPGVGLVNGFKISRADAWYRSVLGNLYHSFVRLAFGLKIRDTDCDFRLIHRRVLEHMSTTTTSGAICVELVRKIQDTGCQIVEVPVNHYVRKAGRSQFFSLKHLTRTLFQLPKLWFELVFKPKFIFFKSIQTCSFDATPESSPNQL